MRNTLKSSFALTAIFLFLAGCGSPRLRETKDGNTTKNLNRSSAIEKFLSGRDLTSIEGIWVWEDNAYEVVVVRNTFGEYTDYQYLGLITDSQRTGWKRGDIKFFLKDTASPEIFSGLYLMGNAESVGTTFLMTNPNLIEYYAPTGPYGTKQKHLLLRVYPKTQTASTTPSKGVSSTGTGFFISSDIVATNCHVVAEAKTTSVRVGNSQVKTDILLQDRQNDLALLKISPNADPLAANTLKASIKCLTIGNPDAVKAGERVYVLGFPLSGILGSSVSVSEGIVNNTVGLQDDPRMYQISVPIQPGSSGSPLLNSSGQVVGVVTSVLNNKFLFASTGVIPQNVNFAVKATYLRSMIALVPDFSCNALENVDRTLNPQEIKQKHSGAVVQVEAIR